VILVATNYMKEADTESIWNTQLDTTRFGKIGVRIAEQLNFWINDDATSQITDTKVTPILEQISEEILIGLLNKAKVEKDPYQFMAMQVTRTSRDILRNYGDILQKIRQVISKEKIELVQRDLPSSTSDW